MEPKGGRGREAVLGLFGPREAARQMQACAEELLIERDLSMRIVMVGYTERNAAREQYLKLAPRADAIVFAGQLQHDRAQTYTDQAIPSVHVAVSGDALFAALLRAAPSDPSRVSIDSMTRTQVDSAYAELGLDGAAVPVLPYSVESMEAFAAFHRELQQSGEADLALTTRSSVERTLRREGIAVQRLRPTRATVQEAVEKGMLLAVGAKKGEQQIAYILVQLLASGDISSPPYWQQDAMLAMQTLVLGESRRIGATLTARQDTVVITTTLGGVEELTDALSHAPFLTRIREDLGVPVAVGVGLGRTAIGAELNAARSLARSAEHRGEHAYLADDDQMTELPVAAEGPTTVADGHLTKTLTQLVADPEVARTLVVSGDDVARVLGVTLRTGQRTLRGLVAAGLAWPLPAEQVTQAGRPRQQFRLISSRVPSARADAQPTPVPQPTPVQGEVR